MLVLQVGVLLNENLLLIKTKQKKSHLAGSYVDHKFRDIFPFIYIIHDSEMPIIDTEMPKSLFPSTVCGVHSLGTLCRENNLRFFFFFNNSSCKAFNKNIIRNKIQIQAMVVHLQRHLYIFYTV